MDSRPGTGVRPAVRVIITVWLTSGRVYSVLREGCRAAEGAYAGANIVFYTKLLQRVELSRTAP